MTSPAFGARNRVLLAERLRRSFAMLSFAALGLLSSCGSAPPRASWKVDQSATRPWEGSGRKESCNHDEPVPVRMVHWELDHTFDALEDPSGQRLLDQDVDWWRSVVDSQYILREVQRDNACAKVPSRETFLQLVHRGIVLDSLSLGSPRKPASWQDPDDDEQSVWTVDQVNGSCLKDWADPILKRMGEEEARHKDWARSVRTRYLLDHIAAKRYRAKKQDADVWVEIDLQAHRFVTVSPAMERCTR